LQLLSNSALEYAMKKVQENQEETELNETYQLLAYADNVNMLAKNTNTIKKNKLCWRTVGR